jgi:hypothetical protein
MCEEDPRHTYVFYVIENIFFVSENQGKLKYEFTTTTTTPALW